MDKKRALSIRNPEISRIVKVPGPFEIIFTKAETQIFKYFSDFIHGVFRLLSLNGIVRFDALAL